MSFTIKWKSFALRYTSAALCISLLTGMFGGLDIRAVSPAPSAQIGAAGNEGWTPSKQPGVLGRHEGDLSLAALPYAQLSDQDVPECVGTAQAEEKDHVKRLYKQETDLHTVIFQNRDGSKTMYYYNIPVKYVDEKGVVRDKSNALEVPASRALTEYGFENKANDVKTYFPQKLDTGSGVLLEHTDIRIEMAPERAVKYAGVNDNLEQEKGRLPQDLLTAGMDAADNGLAPGLQRKVNLDAVPAPGVKQIIADEESSAEMVAYDDVFGDGTTLRYAPTYTGFKEDIVLDSYTGMHEFSFIVKTHGLALVPHETSAYFVDPLTGEQKAWLGEILVHDSAGVFSDSSSYSHQYKIEKIRQDEEYRVTLIVDPAYLRAPERVYPVTIDPSITINFRGIQDATIYSNYQSSEGLSGSIFVGNYSSRYGGSKGVARTLVQFPGFLDNSTYVSLWSNQIQNVTYYIRDLMCESDTVQIDYYRATKHWEELDVKCSCEMWYAYKDYLGSINVGYNKGVSSPGGSGSGQWYGLDLTDIAKEWKKGTTDRYGIMMRAENELRGARTFASADRGSNLPVVIVEYNENTIPVSQVCVSPTYKGMYVGETAYLTATVLPSNASNKGVYYLSSDSNIVGVGYDSGLICARRSGTATITVYSSEDPSIHASCTVKVVMRYCGGDSYRDVTKHDLIMQNDGSYKCWICNYKVKSPILQDKDILSQEDYLRVVSCEQAYIYYSYLAENQLCSITGLYAPYGLLKLIDDIRSSPEYAQKYDYQDGSGKYYRSMEDKYTTFIPEKGEGPLPNYLTTLRVSATKITNANILLYNGVLEGIGEIALGLASFYFGVPSEMVSAIMISLSDKDIVNSSNNILQILIGQIKDDTLSIPLSILLDMIVLGSDYKDMEVGDWYIRMEMKHGVEGYTTYITYSSEGNLKKIENDYTVNGF